MKQSHIGRWLFTTDGITKGCLRLDDDQVAEVCYGDAPSDSSRSLVLPGFVNAHTHVGDSFAFPAPKGSVEELVAPPDGYKHRMLRSAARETKLTAMTDAVEIMAATGTTAFIDFREEGVAGVIDLLSAVRSSVPLPVILGRPEGLPASDRELDEILASCDGLGLSAMRDMEPAQAARIASRARSAGRMFALHASEAVREDIDRILDLHPDFLVHMTSANDDDIQACADEGVPVVVCPRSNEFFGLDPKIPRLLAAGVDVALGTDNGMIARPDMLSELQAAHRLSRGGLSHSQAVHLATFGGRKVLSAKGKITTGIGISDDLVVVDVRGSDPLGEVVTSAGSSSVSAVIHGGRLRRPENWTR